MVRRGLARDVEAAQLLVRDGVVLVAGSLAMNAARLVDPAESLDVRSAPRFVGRGGEKLDAALDHLGVEVAGRRVLDAGASTGGFTDCLLQRGAAAVVAVDTGHHQLHERLRVDARVDVRERTDVRSLQPDEQQVDLVVADLSFIALCSVLESLLALVRPGGELLLLVKPQFEATREEADRGRGVIRDPAIWRRVLHENIDALRERRATIMGVVASTLRGSAGNVEFFVHARRPFDGAADGLGCDLDASIEEAVRDGRHLAAAED